MKSCFSAGDAGEIRSIRQRRGAISPYRSAASLLQQAADRGGRRAGGLPVCALFLAVGAGELGSYRAAGFRSMRALEVPFDDTLSRI
jgi:hypothetical protein